MGCHFLLQRIFPTQGSNLGLPHCRQMLYHLSHQGSLNTKEGMNKRAMLCSRWQYNLLTALLCLFRHMPKGPRHIHSASLVAQMVKHLPTMRETQVQSLGWEDMEKEMATHSSILAWRIARMEEYGRLQSMGLQRVGHD